MSSGGDADFVDYMAREAAAKAAAAEQAERLARHQLWKETTFAGRLSTWFTKLGELPFVQAVIHALQDQEDGKSIPALLLRNFARLAIVFAGITAAYILGKIIQLIIGKEIVIHQDVVVVEEIPRSQAEKEERSGDTTDTKGDESRRKLRRSARDKKKTN